MHKALVTLAIIVLLVGSGCSRSEVKDTDTYKHVEKEDQAMNAAIAKARETSRDFVSAFHLHQSGTKDFFVKKPYTTPSNGAEHMWIEVRAETNGIISGIIANDAEETQEVKLGDPVSVKIEEISDWKYQDGRKLVGGYTIRYFVERMSPKERANFFKEAGFEL